MADPSTPDVAPAPPTPPPPAPPPPTPASYYGPQGSTANAFPGVAQGLQGLARFFSQNVAPAFSVQPPKPAPPAQPPAPPAPTAPVGAAAVTPPGEPAQPSTQSTQPAQPEEHPEGKPQPEIPKIGDLLKPQEHPTTVRRFPQRFVPNTGRDHSEWGKPNKASIAATRNPDFWTGSPFMPNDQEAINVIRGAGRQLAQFSAPGVGVPMGIAAGIASIIGPFFDFFSGNAFSTAYRQRMLGGLQAQEAQLRMQEEQMQMNRERMLDYTQQAMISHKEMLGEYGMVFDELRAKYITPQEAHDKLLQLNAKNQHHWLDNILENQGPGAVQKYLEWEDAKYQDIVSSVTTLRTSDKTSGKTKGETSLDDLIDGKTPGDSYSSSLLGAPLTNTGDGTIPQSYGVRDTIGAYDNDIAKNAGLPEAGERYSMGLAHELASEGTITGETLAGGQKAIPKNYGRVVAASDDIKHRVSHVLSDPSLSEQEKLDEVQKIDPDIASKLQGLNDYTGDPKNLPNTVRQNYLNWAKQLNNKFSDANFARANEFADSKGKAHQLLDRAASLPQNALSVFAATKNMKENELIPERKIEQWAMGNITGEEKYRVLATSIRQFAQDVSSIQSGGGTVRVTLVEEMLKNMPPNASPAAIRAWTQQETAAVWSQVASSQKDWEGFGKKDIVPGFNKEAWQNYSAILRADAHAGTFPSDAPTTYLSVSKPGAKIAPPTAAEARELEEHINKLRQSSDPRAQAQLNKLLMHYIPVNDPPWMREDADR